MDAKDFLKTLSEKRPKAVELLLEEFHKFNEAGAPYHGEPYFRVPEEGFYDFNSFFNSFFKVFSEFPGFEQTIIDWAFNWNETPQGAEYWSEIDWLMS